MHKPLLLILILITITQSAYEPELLLTAKAPFINKFIANYSDEIIERVNNYSIRDPDPIEEKVAGVKITVTLKNIKQKVDINWTTNVITVPDTHSFKINSKNINITIDADVEAKIGVLKKQKGPLKVIVTKLATNTTLLFDNPKCSKSIGFDLQIQDVFVDASNVSIKIEGKSFDNTVIALIEKYLTPRIPSLLQKAITTQVNPLISELACNRIEEEININDKYYMLTLNTTEVPVFDDKLQYLKLLVDLTLQNMLTNQTNNQLERDDLPGDPALSDTFDLSIAASSNFLNTVVWLVGDSQLLHGTVTNSMLGDNPPIALNTTNLTILMPNIKTKEWVNKEVFLMIAPSTKYEHLLIRSGRVVTVFSLSIKFVVNVTGRITNATECIQKNQCAIACDLNITLPLSLALKMNKTDVQGLIHSVSLYDIQIINSQIDINIDSLKSILNSIVGSMIPTVNTQLVQSIKVPEALYNITEQYHVGQLQTKTYLDYLGIGLTIDF